MKKIFLILVIVSFAFLTGFRASMAQEDVGNEVCPVTGEKINESSKATYGYKGKIYNFCCPMCIDEFKKNPDKYAAIAGQDNNTDHSTHEDHHHH